MPRYPLLTIPGDPDTRRFISTKSGRDNFTTPPRNRANHARSLLQAIDRAQADRPEGRQIGNGFYQPTDLILTFESDPDFPLAFESLDLPRSKIDLLTVSSDAEGRTLATVRIPDDKIATFIHKLEAYRDNPPDKALAEGEKKHRDNRKLAESISQIRRATLRSFWTDDPAQYPAPGAAITWEVWLRRARGGEELPETILAAAQEDLGYTITSQPLAFVDRTVILVRGTVEQLSLGADLLGVIAELRRAKVTTGFFDTLSIAEQHDWIANLNGRVTAAAADAPVLGLLDTGVNRGHPLLAPLIADGDLHTYKPQWGVNDTWPHGTTMAGLALFGDLAPLFEADGEVTLTHRLHSVKLIHGPDPHDPDLYGAVTKECVTRLEVDAAPRRLYCMAITTDGRDRGRPSSWSAAIDELACGAVNDTRRLVLVSAGNTDFDNRTNYPADNEASSVQDPAQSWNALTVGGTTEKVLIDTDEHDGWLPVATSGDLAPASTTSLTWPRSNRWPFKPDIVMEAGNMARPAADRPPDYVAELSLLTTNHQFAVGQRPLTISYDTSAATALAARLAAALWAQYPDFTPETLRGLLVHSARWTPAMLARVTNAAGITNTANLLRTFGYGTPDVDALFSCANNELTLIAQSTIQPFFKDVSHIKSRDLNMHALPWPVAALQALPANTEVKLRVTLSYFIEPSPGERGWDKKYGYASHGLRFAVQRPTETAAEFALRINKHGRDDEYDEDAHQDDTGEWFLGANTPPNGSIHSNIWTGTAAELANRSRIAIYPTMGWWRTRPSEQRYEREVNYSLIVSIETPDVATDIYTPIAALIGIENLVAIEIQV